MNPRPQSWHPHSVTPTHGNTNTDAPHCTQHTNTPYTNTPQHHDRTPHTTVQYQPPYNQPGTYQVDQPLATSGGGGGDAIAVRDAGHLDTRRLSHDEGTQSRGVLPSNHRQYHYSQNLPYSKSMVNLLNRQDADAVESAVKRQQQKADDNRRYCFNEQDSKVLHPSASWHGGHLTLSVSTTDKSGKQNKTSMYGHQNPPAEKVTSPAAAAALSSRHHNPLPSRPNVDVQPTPRKARYGIERKQDMDHRIEKWMSNVPRGTDSKAADRNSADSSVSDGGEGNRPCSPPAPPVRDVSSMVSAQIGHTKSRSFPFAKDPTKPKGGKKSDRNNTWTSSVNPIEELPSDDRDAGVYNKPRVDRVLEPPQQPLYRYNKAANVSAKVEDVAHSTYNSEGLYNRKPEVYTIDRDGRAPYDKDYISPSPPERDSPLAVLRHAKESEDPQYKRDLGDSKTSSDAFLQKANVNYNKYPASSSPSAGAKKPQLETFTMANSQSHVSYKYTPYFNTGTQTPPQLTSVQLHSDVEPREHQQPSSPSRVPVPSMPSPPAVIQRNVEVQVTMDPNCDTQDNRATNAPQVSPHSPGPSWHHAAPTPNAATSATRTRKSSGSKHDLGAQSEDQPFTRETSWKASVGNVPHPDAVPNESSILRKLSHELYVVNTAKHQKQNNSQQHSKFEKGANRSLYQSSLKKAFDTYEPAAVYHDQYQGGRINFMEAWRKNGNGDNNPVSSTKEAPDRSSQMDSDVQQYGNRRVIADSPQRALRRSVSEQVKSTKAQKHAMLDGEGKESVLPGDATEVKHSGRVGRTSDTAAYPTPYKSDPQHRKSDPLQTYMRQLSNQESASADDHRLNDASVQERRLSQADSGYPASAQDSIKGSQMLSVRSNSSSSIDNLTYTKYDHAGMLRGRAYESAVHLPYTTVAPGSRMSSSSVESSLGSGRTTPRSDRLSSSGPSNSSVGVSGTAGPSGAGGHYTPGGGSGGAHLSSSLSMSVLPKDQSYSAAGGGDMKKSGSLSSGISQPSTSSSSESASAMKRLSKWNPFSKRTKSAGNVSEVTRGGDVSKGAHSAGGASTEPQQTRDSGSTAVDTNRLSSNSLPGADDVFTQPELAPHHAVKSTSANSGSTKRGSISSPESTVDSSYQETVNSTYQETEDEGNAPPTLPPRNYRPTSAKPRINKQPVEPPQSPLNHHHQQVYQQPYQQHHRLHSGDHTTTPPHGNLHTSSDSSDFDSTPKADQYADKLREQARIFNSKQGIGIDVIRYQQFKRPNYQNNPVNREENSGGMNTAADQSYRHIPPQQLYQQQPAVERTAQSKPFQPPGTTAGRAAQGLHQPQRSDDAVGGNLPSTAVASNRSFSSTGSSGDGGSMASPVSPSQSPNSDKMTSEVQDNRRRSLTDQTHKSTEQQQHKDNRSPQYMSNRYYVENTYRSQKDNITRQGFDGNYHRNMSDQKSHSADRTSIDASVGRVPSDDRTSQSQQSPSHVTSIDPPQDETIVHKQSVVTMSRPNESQLNHSGSEATYGNASPSVRNFVSNYESHHTPDRVTHITTSAQFKQALSNSDKGAPGAFIKETDLDEVLANKQEIEKETKRLSDSKVGVTNIRVEHIHTSTAGDSSLHHTSQSYISSIAANKYNNSSTGVSSSSSILQNLSKDASFGASNVTRRQMPHQELTANGYSSDETTVKQSVINLQNDAMTNQPSKMSPQSQLPNITSSFHMNVDQSYKSPTLPPKKLSYPVKTAELSRTKEACPSSSNDLSVTNGSLEHNNASTDEDGRTKDAYSHVRQKSQEEIEYEQRAKMLVKQLDSENKDTHFCNVIAPPERKTASDYMHGLFDTSADITRKSVLLPGLKISPRRHTTNKGYSINIPEQALTREELDDPSAAIRKQKEDLVEKLQKKLEILGDEKQAIECDVKDNDALGKEVSTVVSEKCSSEQEVKKYERYMQDMQHVLPLLLNLSSQLARADNQLSEPLLSDSDKVSLQKKRDDIFCKHGEAKELKEVIDMKSKQISRNLTKYLTKEEYGDYEHHLKMKARLMLELHEIQDKITESEQQLEAVTESLATSQA